MKKCAFNSSFAGGGREKQHDFSLLDSLLSVMTARKSAETNCAGHRTDDCADDAKQDFCDTAPDSDESFAKCVENAKNRSGGSKKKTKTAQNLYPEKHNLSQNGENRKNRDCENGENVKNRKNDIFTNTPADAASSDEKRGAKNGEDYYSPPPCYRV